MKKLLRKIKDFFQGTTLFSVDLKVNLGEDEVVSEMSIGPEVYAAFQLYKQDPLSWSITKVQYGHSLSNGAIGFFITSPHYYRSVEGINWQFPKEASGTLFINDIDRAFIREIYREVGKRQDEERTQLARLAFWNAIANREISSEPKPILLIDMDGVVADYYGAFVETWMFNHPERDVVSPDDMHSFYIEDVYHKDHTADIFSITRSKGFFARLKPLPNAVEMLQRILAEGDFEPFLCTAPDNDYEDLLCPSEKAIWVKETLGDEWLKRLILTKDKTIIAGDYMVDDKPEMKGLKSDNPSWKRIVFNHAYNQKTEGIRMNGWADWDRIEHDILMTEGE